MSAPTYTLIPVLSWMAHLLEHYQSRPKPLWRAISSRSLWDQEMRATVNSAKYKTENRTLDQRSNSPMRKNWRWREETLRYCTRNKTHYSLKGESVLVLPWFWGRWGWSSSSWRRTSWSSSPSASCCYVYTCVSNVKMRITKQSLLFSLDGIFSKYFS